MAFVDLQKAFDRVPRKALWWTLRVAGVPEWLVKVVHAMYVGARSRTRVKSSFSEEFEFKVGVHQGLVLSPLLFIIALEALSCEFRVGCPWEMLYADDLVILAETFGGLMTKKAVWKNSLELKGLKVNMGKTKVMISGRDFHTLQTSNKHSCAVCRKGVVKSSVVDVRFGFTKSVPVFPIDWLKILFLGVEEVLVMQGQLMEDLCVEVQLADGKLDVVANFVYLSDCICPGGGCELATTKRCRSAWGKFRELLPLLTCNAITLHIWSNV